MVLAEIISVGAEVISGETINTNAAYLGERLTSLGFFLTRQLTVDDRIEEVAAAIREALGRAQMVFVTGGLGPTEDDLTREGVALALGVPLEEDPDLRLSLESRGMGGQALSRQATIIKGSRIVANALGSAPGLLLSSGGKGIFLLPGPPRELEAVFQRAISDGLLPESEKVTEVAFRICGISEAEVEAGLLKIGGMLGKNNPRVATYVGGGSVRIRAMAQGQGAEKSLLELEEQVKGLFGHRFYGKGNTSLEEAIGSECVRRGVKLAVAESCTGGLLSDRLTNVPGASDYLWASWVTYTLAAKEKFLGIPRELLERGGAVSREVAGMMAQRARFLAETDVGLATTGLAGPGGGTSEKPVGTVYIALASTGGTMVAERFFRGDRGGIKFSATQALLVMLWDWFWDRER